MLIYLLDGGQNAKRDDEGEQRDRVAEFRNGLHDREKCLRKATEKKKETRLIICIQK